MAANMAVAIGRLSQLGTYFRQSKGSGPVDTKLAGVGSRERPSVVGATGSVSCGSSSSFSLPPPRAFSSTILLT